MAKKNQNEIGQKALELSPVLTEVHVTSDGIPFVSKSAAVHHAVTNKLNADSIVKVSRVAAEPENTDEEKLALETAALEKEAADAKAKEKADAKAKKPLDAVSKAKQLDDKKA